MSGKALICIGCGTTIFDWELNDGGCPVCESHNVKPIRSNIGRLVKMEEDKEA